MDAFGSVNSTYRLLIATTTSAIAAITFDRLQILFKSRALALAGLLVVISLFVILLSKALEELIERSVGVRRFIEGDRFIEGFWYDLSIDSQARKVIHGVLIRIRFQEGSFAVEGVTFDPAGNRIATWGSTSTAFSDLRLSFEYRGMNDEHGDVVETGFGQLQFDAPPQSYSGFYFDYTAHIHGRVHGYKVSRDALKQHHNFVAIESKRLFILPLMAARQAEIEARPSAAPVQVPTA
jgi:hypothetical protein